MKLHDAIMNGVFHPGEVLRQEELARNLGVSRAPLREALPRLEADGIVVLRPRRGYAVVSLDTEEIEDIFDLRAILEEKAVRLATVRRTEEDISTVRAALSEMQRLGEPQTPEERAKWFDLNSRFHDTLVAACGRRHLRRAVSSFRFVVEPYIRMEVNLTGDLEQADGEHERIVEAFVAGDVDAAAEIARIHVQHTADRLLSGLRAERTQLVLPES